MAVVAALFQSSPENAFLILALSTGFTVILATQASASGAYLLENIPSSAHARGAALQALATTLSGIGVGAGVLMAFGDAGWRRTLGALLVIVAVCTLTLFMLTIDKRRAPTPLKETPRPNFRMFRRGNVRRLFYLLAIIHAGLVLPFSVKAIIQVDAGIVWSLGGSYFNVDYASAIKLARTRPLPFPPGGAIDIRSTTNVRIKTETFALFGDVSTPTTDRLRASLSLRVATDDQEFVGVDTTAGAAPFPIVIDNEAETDETCWTGRIGAVYKLSETSSLYANVARGFSSEGFQRASIPTGVFESGRSLAYEAGYRAFLFDQRLSLDATAFFNDVENAPFTELVDFANFVFEIRTQDYTTYGLELQAEALLVEDLEVFGVFGWQEGERNDTNSADPAVAGAGRVPGVPEVTASAGLRWTPSLAALGLPGAALASVDAQYVGDRAGNLRNTVTLDAYWIANARLAWQIDKAEVYFFARNLADERFEASGFSFPPNAQGVVPAAGRILGGGIAFSF